MKKIVMLVFTFTLMMVACKKSKTDTKISDEQKVIVEQKSDSNEWVALFDGSTLDHWRGYLSDSMPSEWSIDNNTLVFTAGSEGGKNIITKEKYTNFILSMEWKIAEGGNSGVLWGIYEDPTFNEIYETGPEIQVLDNERHPDALVASGTHKAGSLYDMIAYPEEMVNPAGEWNLCVLEINHETNLGKVSMNGKEEISFPVHGEDWDAMVANSKFKNWKGFGKYKTGHIGLQDHGNKVWFRNIKIKKL